MSRPLAQCRRALEWLSDCSEHGSGAWGWLGSPFLPLLLSGSQPCWSRRAVLRVAHVPGWMCLLLQGHLCWLSDLRAASCPCRHAHHKGICLGTCTASSSQGSHRLSAAEETEAWRGDAASSGPGCWRGPCPAFLPCCPGCLLNVFPGASSQKPLGGALPALWTPGKVGARGSGWALWALWALWAGSFKPSPPHRMLQNNRLGGIPAEALWELPGLQSL